MTSGITHTKVHTILFLSTLDKVMFFFTSFSNVLENLLLRALLNGTLNWIQDPDEIFCGYETDLSQDGAMQTWL